VVAAHGGEPQHGGQAEAGAEVDRPDRGVMVSWRITFSSIWFCDRNGTAYCHISLFSG
jgi:hypothetical protein